MPSFNNTVYALAHHTYACRTADGVVLLDLRRNLYIGLDHADAEVLACTVQGWPSIQTSPSRSSLDGPAHPILRRMIADGQIAPCSSPSQVAERASVSAATDDLCSDLALATPRISWRDKATFGAATVTSKVQWHTWSIERTIDRIRSLKSRMNSKTSASTHEALRLALVFYFLRPWIRTAKDQCLFDSISLMKFLLLNSAIATLIIGVRTGPFAAHCWVQTSDVVLNSSLDHCRQFTPILIV